MLYQLQIYSNVLHHPRLLAPTFNIDTYNWMHTVLQQIACKADLAVIIHFMLGML
jgi:hypothetical protein